ncbi:MAG TPA: 30S ribosomal protein S5 [Phycisphaerae bacterium]|nr:30S ribosomal protein S5 [Phycisphaerae bacterium]
MAPDAATGPYADHAPSGTAGGQGGYRGGRPGRGGREGRPGRGDRFRRDSEAGESGLDEAVVKVYRCAKVVKGGRRFSFAALVVVGDRTSKVGVGYGKANEVPSAVDKARKQAQRNMVEVKLDGTTIPHQVKAKYRASQVIVVPAGRGTGVIAGASVRAVMELAGIKDVLTKVHGSTSPKNLVKAAFAALTLLRSKDDVARLRDVAIA